MEGVFKYLAGYLSGESAESKDGNDSESNPDHVGSESGAHGSQTGSKQTVQRITPMAIDTPIYADKVRFVCVSDTHAQTRHDNYVIPEGDVLLHAGDFTMYGKPDEVHTVNKYLASLPHPYKVVIAGNHDMSFDLDFVASHRASPFWTLHNRDFKPRLEAHGVGTVHEMMSGCIYLQDSAVDIYGIKIYGSPWTLGNSYWGFQVDTEAKLQEKWSQIPDNTDILITHSPPSGHGDSSAATRVKAMLGMRSDEHVGSVALLNTVQERVKPSHHVFGHIHKGYGVTTDGFTHFINAATCNGRFKAVNPPIIFDIPLPANQQKTKRALLWDFQP